MLGAHLLKGLKIELFGLCKNKDLNQGLDLTPGVYTEPFNVI